MPLTADNYVCGACAAYAIENLRTHKNAEDALTHLCKTYLGVKLGAFNVLPAHYVFVAGPEVDGKCWSSKTWLKYRTEFAQYLEEHRLGLIVTAGQTVNKKHHSDTTCQVWIWQVDQKAVEAWWTKQLKAGVVKPEEARW